MDPILYEIFKIIEYTIEKPETVTDNFPIRICIHKIENGITFKIKKGYYLQHWMPETMKFLGSTKNKITKDENGEYILHFEIAEVVLVHCNISNNDY